jgi:hypothetical protein
LLLCRGCDRYSCSLPLLLTFGSPLIALRLACLADDQVAIGDFCPYAIESFPTFS